MRRDFEPCVYKRKGNINKQLYTAKGLLWKMSKACAFLYQANRRPNRGVHMKRAGVFNNKQINIVCKLSYF